MTEIYEYDGPTAWADMTAVEKMEAWLNGDVAECDEREVFRQAIREAKSEAECLVAMTAAHRESQAEVARLRAALEGLLVGTHPDGGMIYTPKVSAVLAAFAALEPAR